MNDAGAAPQISIKDAAICTLFEGDYHLGLAALVNSLARAAFRGTVWAGYRGMLPPWTYQLERIKERNGDAFLVTDRIALVFLKLDTQVHFTNYKPDFMLRLLKGEAYGCSYLWYFDPDIFLLANWSYFEKWQSYGIALCQEIVDNIFPADAPLRQEWMKLAAGAGFTQPRQVNHYYCAGMVGVAAEHTEFLQEWKRLILLAESLGYDLRLPAQGGRERAFSMRDQDALNIAIMYTKAPLSTLGPQGMGFIYGASTVMYHASVQKPWRGSILLRALKGLPPNGAIKFFFTQVSSPIRAYNPIYVWAKRITCMLTSFLGRFYRRY